jgi:hypothetical protein
MSSTHHAFYVILIACGMNAALSAQTLKTINVNEPSPLASALQSLEAALGVPINYEDPPYENIADVQDVSTPQQRAARPGYQNLVPRSGKVTAQIQIPLATSPTAGDAVSGANVLLVNYRQNALPGDFTVEQANGMLYVIPTKIVSASGAMKSVTSPLTTSVTVPFAKRTISDTVQAILEAVNKSTGLKLVIGNLPFWPTDEVSFGVSNVPARDALAQLFAKKGKYCSYNLLFDPLPDTVRIFDYMINVRVAGYIPPTAPAGLGPVGASQATAPPAQPTTNSSPAFIKAKP